METVNHETYVSLEIAKLLKEAGFDWKGMSYYQGGIFYQYSIDKERIVIMNQNSAPDYMEQYSAPTLDVAQKWLREVKGIHISIGFTFITNKYLVSILWCTNDNSKTPFENECSYVIRTTFKTYEEAQEAGIKKALEIILEKGE